MIDVAAVVDVVVVGEVVGGGVGCIDLVRSVPVVLLGEVESAVVVVVIVLLLVMVAAM